MRLWLLQRPADDVGWDETAGVVVRAETEREARKLAGDEAGDEGPSAWLKPHITCKPLSPNEGKAEVILRDFNAG